MTKPEESADVSSDSNYKFQNIIEPILIIVGIMVFYHPIWLSTSVFPGGDFINLFVPMREYTISTVFGDGVIPLWNHYVYMGVPHAATLQHAVFYPVTYLFSFLDNNAYGLKLQNLLHLCFCGIGVWFLCRKAFRFSILPSLFAALVFPCSSWFWVTFEHANRIAGVAYLPWNFAVLILLLTNRIKPLTFILLTSFLLSCQFLSGHPQSMFYGLMVYGFVICYFGIHNKKEVAQSLLKAIIPAFILVGFLVSIQLIMTLELSGHSYRPIYSQDPAYSLTVSQIPSYFMHLINPGTFDGLNEELNRHAYGEHHLFIGRLTLIAALIGLVFLFIKKRSVGIAATLLLIFLILFMLGGNASIYRLFNVEFDTAPLGMKGDGAEFDTSSILTVSLYEFLSWFIPPLKGFRVPVRILNLFTLELVILSAFALDQIRQIKVQNVVCFLGFVFVMIELYVPSKTYHFHDQFDQRMLEFPQEVQNLSTAVNSEGGRIFRLHSLDHFRSTASLLTVDDQVEEAILARYHYSQENLNILLRLPSIQGYEEGIIPTVRTKDFLYRIAGQIRSKNPDPVMLRLLGVNAILAELEVGPPYQRDERFETRTHSVYFVPKSSIAFWEDDAIGIDWLSLEGPYFQGEDFLKSRSFEPLNYGHNVNWNSEAQDLDIALSPNSILLEAEQVNSNAIVSLGYFPYWKVNGDGVEWLNAIHAQVPQNSFINNKILLEFKPKSYRIGVLLTAFGLMIWFGLLSFWIGSKKQEFKNA